MSDRRLVVGSLLAAVVAAGTLGVLTESLAILGVAPAGVAVYLLVGLALPQYVLARREGSPLRLGLATFAATGAAVALVAGAIGDGINATSSISLGSVLAIALLGVLLGATVREFRAGYRSERG